MAKLTKRSVAFFYRILILFFGFLFLSISGCRPKNPSSELPEQTAEHPDTILLITPEEDELPADVTKETGNKTISTEKQTTQIPEEKKQETQQEQPKPVEQPAPDPMRPVTAYGTHYKEYRTIVQPGTPEE